MSRGIDTQLVLQQFFVGEWALNVKHKLKKNKAAGCLVELITYIRQSGKWILPQSVSTLGIQILLGVSKIFKGQKERCFSALKVCQAEQVYRQILPVDKSCLEKNTLETRPTRPLNHWRLSGVMNLGDDSTSSGLSRPAKFSKTIMEFGGWQPSWNGLGHVCTNPADIVDERKHRLMWRICPNFSQHLLPYLLSPSWQPSRPDFVQGYHPKKPKETPKAAPWRWRRPSAHWYFDRGTCPGTFRGKDGTPWCGQHVNASEV